MESSNFNFIWRRSLKVKEKKDSFCRQTPKLSCSAMVIAITMMICLLGFCALGESLPYESKTLRLVIAIIRHGARAPNESYKSDPYKNYQWPNGLGGLTNKGKLQLYELGKKYRSYYSNFLPEEYFDKDVLVRSSDTSRCLMSAATFLAGLYPPSPRQAWHPDIPWQPVPVHSVPVQMDQIIITSTPCKLHTLMHKEQLAEKNSDPKLAELFNYLTTHTNQSIHSLEPVDFLYSTLLSQQDVGLELPEWTKNVFPHKMRTPFMLSLALLSYNETLQKLRVGPLLGEIKQSLEETVSQVNVDRSLLVYSGHDVTLVALWRALGFQELIEPEYGASLVLELHEHVDNFFVKTFYRNNTELEVPMELKLPFCDDACPFNQFIGHISKFIPDDWEVECQNI